MSNHSSCSECSYTPLKTQFRMSHFAYFSGAILLSQCIIQPGLELTARFLLNAGFCLMCTCHTQAFLRHPSVTPIRFKTLLFRPLFSLSPGLPPPKLSFPRRWLEWFTCASSAQLSIGHRPARPLCWAQRRFFHLPLAFLFETKPLACSWGETWALELAGGEMSSEKGRGMS